MKKLIKAVLGQDDLEARILELEARMCEHTDAMKCMADALRVQSKALVVISSELKILINDFNLDEVENKKYKIKTISDDTYH